MSFNPRFLLATGLIGLLFAVAAREGVMLSTTAEAAGTYDTATARYQALRQSDTGINVGRQGTAAAFHQAAVFPFQLPNLGPVATPFENDSPATSCKIR